MKNFTAEELKKVLTKMRNRENLSEEELEGLKKCVPLHLDKENAEKMSKLVSEIRAGKRPPMTPEERAALHKKNIELTIKNMQNTLPNVSEQEFQQILLMCESLRQQIR